MAKRGLEHRLTELLQRTNRAGGYPLSMLCTGQGLLMASAGEGEHTEEAAGLVGLFDDIAVRAARDLPIGEVDELTLVGGSGERYIIRPLPVRHEPRLFLCVVAPRRATWRRNTTQLLGALSIELAPLLEAPDDAD